MSTYDPLDLRGQERAREQKKTRELANAEESAGDIRWLMNSGKGRRIVWRLLEFAGVNRPTFNPNAIVMGFNEGQRNTGNFLLDQIMAICPEQYVQMLKEHRAKEKEKHGDGAGPKLN